MQVKLISNATNETDLAHIARLSRGIRTDFPVRNTDPEQDKRTLKFLLQHKHLSVFEFATVVFEVECPIFVARQLMRYRHCSFLERSLRYCEPLMEEDSKDNFRKIVADYYKELLQGGAKKEDARKCLTLDTTTVFYVATNLRELLHIFDERLTKETQKETREVVYQMSSKIYDLYPTIMREWDLLKNGNNDN